MRVPTGSICGLVSHAAWRSNLMIEPSGRLISLRMRTTTAFIPSPFFTRPRGIASLTETTITSPMVAYRFFEPPSTLMHMTRRAPELSATSRLVCIWIMMLSPLSVPGSSRSQHFLLLLALDHFPALELRQWPTLLDPDQIAYPELVLLVVGVVLLRPPYSLLHHRMGEAPLDAHHHGLVLLVAYDDALQRALRHLGSPNSSTSRVRCASARSWPWSSFWLWSRPWAWPPRPAAPASADRSASAPRRS